MARRAIQDRVAAGILEAAAAVLAERGEAASMDEVAAAAGVGRATLYRYFPNREVLLEALLARALQEARERLEQAQLAAVPVEEAIARIVRALLSVGDRYIVLVRSEVSKHAAERELGDSIHAVFERGRETGALRSDLSTDWLEELLGGLIIAGLTYASQRGLGIEETSAAIVAVFLDGATTAPVSVRPAGPARPE